jgi:hypothetical protein
MPVNRPSNASHQPELGAAAQAEWNRHVEAVLRGIAHALNNRAAALSALVQLADDSEPAETLRTLLSGELDRVGGLAAAIRSIAKAGEGEEAFLPSDAAAESRAVLALHSDQREVTTRIEPQGSQPVRTRRALFVRALIVLAANAGREDPEARLVIVSSEDDVTVRVEGATMPSPLIMEIARAMGGEALDEGRGFRLPTLGAIRRREGS